MKKTTSTVSIDSVISLIEESKIKNPKFQRDFVWKTSDIVSLLDSISKGIPIGGLLIWRSKMRPEEVKPFAGVRGEKRIEHEARVVIDGQQRLTSLYYAVKGKGVAENIYINLSKMDSLLRGEYSVDDSVFEVIGDHVISSDLVKFSDIFDNEKEFDFISHDMVSKIYQFRFHITGYHIPVEEISGCNLEEAMNVFKIINSTGKGLTTLDLVAANCMLDIDIRDMLTKVKASFSPSYKGLISTETLDVIKVMDCFTTHPADKFKDKLLNLVPSEISDEFKDAREAFLNAEKLFKTLGVTNQRVTFKQTFIAVALAYYVYEDSVNVVNLTSFINDMQTFNKSIISGDKLQVELFSIIDSINNESFTGSVDDYIDTDKVFLR